MYVKIFKYDFLNLKEIVLVVCVSINEFLTTKTKQRNITSKDFYKTK